MARIRTIKPEFPQSESMGRVSREARLLFVMLWTICDDAGRTRAASRMLASLLYPYDDDARDHIDVWLDELKREECITLYSVDGNIYLQIEKWLKHQKIDRPSKSRFPEPGCDAREASPQSREPEAVDLVPSTVDQEKKELSAGADRASPAFEEFWKAYPTDRNMSRKAAETQWKRLSPDKRTVALAAMPGFKAYCTANAWYRPLHAERFLSQERFEGYAAVATSVADDEESLRAMWGGRAADIIDAIGAQGLDKFRTWLAPARFEFGSPSRIYVAKPFQRNQIEAQLSSALIAVLKKHGGWEIVVDNSMGAAHAA